MALNNIKLTGAVTETDVPDYAPEHATEEFFASRWEEGLPKQRPEWDVPRMSPSTELAGAQRALAAADSKLAHKRKEQAERRQQMDKQWSDLRKKEQLLKQSFVKFNKFVKENQDKRDRARRKMEEEVALQERRGEETKELEERVNSLQKVKDNMEKHVNDYKIYEQYLESVVSASRGRFQSIHDVLVLYERLSDARADLALRQKRYSDLLERARQEMIAVTEEKAQAIEGVDNEITDLQARYDHAQVQTIVWEAVLSRLKTTTAAKTAEMTQVQTSCRNMYQQMCRRKGIPASLPDDDYEHQLVDIKKSILDLKKIVRKARRRATQEEKSKAAEAAASNTAPSTAAPSDKNNLKKKR